MDTDDKAVLTARPSALSKMEGSRGAEKFRSENWSLEQYY
jgi:hypothetical protein